MSPLISEEELYAIDSCDESEYEPMYTEIFEDIRDGSQYYTSFTGEKHAIKCVIAINKLSWNGKER